MKLLFCLVFLLRSVLADDKIVLQNGKTVEGEVVSEDENGIVIKTEQGRLTIQQKDVREVKREGSRQVKESVGAAKNSDVSELMQRAE